MFVERRNIHKFTQSTHEMSSLGYWINNFNNCPRMYHVPSSWSHGEFVVTWTLGGICCFNSDLVNCDQMYQLATGKQIDQVSACRWSRWIQHDLATVDKGWRAALLSHDRFSLLQDICPQSRPESIVQGQCAKQHLAGESLLASIGTFI